MKLIVEMLQDYEQYQKNTRQIIDATLAKKLRGEGKARVVGEVPNKEAATPAEALEGNQPDDDNRQPVDQKPLIEPSDKELKAMKAASKGEK